MTQVDIEKLILENGFKLEDKQGHITYEFGTGDIYRISQLLFKKMNYIPCSTQLKDKYSEDFAYFVENKVREQKVGSIYWYKGTGYTDLDKLFKEYQKLTKPLIV